MESHGALLLNSTYDHLRPHMVHCVTFSHPDYTVGFGITPNLPSRLHTSSESSRASYRSYPLSLPSACDSIDMSQCTLPPVGNCTLPRRSSAPNYVIKKLIDASILNTLYLHICLYAHYTAISTLLTSDFQSGGTLPHAQNHTSCQSRCSTPARTAASRQMARQAGFYAPIRHFASAQ